MDISNNILMQNSSGYQYERNDTPESFYAFT